MSMARSSSGMLTIGRIAYRRDWGDGSAQRGRSVIYDGLVLICNGTDRHEIRHEIRAKTSSEP